MRLLLQVSAVTLGLTFFETRWSGFDDFPTSSHPVFQFTFVPSGIAISIVRQLSSFLVKTINLVFFPQFYDLYGC